jgi:pilus assembly protein CpaC
VSSNAFVSSSSGPGRPPVANGCQLAAIGCWTLLAALSCMVFVSAAAAQLGGNSNSRHDRLELTVGEQKVLDADNVRSFSEGTKGVIDIRLTKDNDRFVVVGLKPGNTTLLFIMMDGTQLTYEVSVTDPNAGPTVSRDAVLLRDNIRLDLYFVELSNSYSHALGIGWPTSITGNGGLSLSFDLQGGSLTGATAVISGSILPRLDFAQTDGWAKVLRRAAVITANGTQASFSGGGEFNVALAGSFGGSVRSITYGSQIGMRPRYDKETGRIELELNADVSDLAPDSGIGAPGRNVSTLQTVVNLELGQSVMLAGLTAASESVGRTGLPGLNEIPILGVLFGRHTEITSQSQNVIFIVPSVMDVVSMQQRALIDEALQSYDDYSGSLSVRKGLLVERPRTK